MSLSPTLEQCLTQWRDWQLEPALSEMPVVSAELSRGKTNQSYLLTTAQHQYVLRIHADSTIFSINRQQEYRIQQALAKTGLGSPIYYQSPDDSYHVSAFIQGNTVNQLDASSDELLIPICNAINQLHGVNLDLPCFSYTQHITHYWQALNQSTTVTPVDSARHARMSALCQQYETDFGQQRHLCHHDLHGDNILLADQALTGQNILFLDWEFAGLGIASFDFAALACELSIDISSISKYSGILATELEMAASVYRYICEVYNRAIVC